MAIDPVTGAILLSMGGAAVSSLWDTPSAASRKFSVDDEIYGPMKQHIDNLQKQKGMARELEGKKAQADMYDMQRRLGGLSYSTRDPAAQARSTAGAMGRGNMARRHQAATTGMQKELMLERLIGSQESGLLGNQLLDRRHTEQMAANIPTYGEKFGAAMGQGAQLLGMSGGKGGKAPAGGGGAGYAVPQFAPLPPVGSSSPEWGATPTGAGSYGGLYGGSQGRGWDEYQRMNNQYNNPYGEGY